MAAIASLILLAAPVRAQTFSILHNFTGAADGKFPAAGLTLDSAGTLYGATDDGGIGFGIVFKLEHRSSGWVLTPLYTFQGGEDGEDPFAKVVFGPDGNLYGTTTSGGGHGNCECYGQDTGCGVVYKLTPPQTACRSTICPWTETVLHKFGTSGDGGCPSSSVTFDRMGNIYGTTTTGGADGGWTETILHDFSGADGADPRSEVTMDQFGNFYGTTFQGGESGYGTVYKLGRIGTGWVENVLYSFAGTTDGGLPDGGVIFDAQGNLYGTTLCCGGFDGDGTVFELSPAPPYWTLDTLNIFSGASGGPDATLTMDSAGNLYGTTFEAPNGYGAVYRLTKAGSSWQFAYLHVFDGADGSYLFSPVVMDAAGNLYGTTWQGAQGCRPYGCGVVWEITP
jgi:uncharacterized repeat protein (TIGR03803 family)